jgi:hypothetical protein
MYASGGQVQDGSISYLTSVSGTNAVTAVAALGMSAYAAGQRFSFLAAGTNTGATTLNINSIGAKAVTKNGTTALGAGDIVSGAIIEVVYDGTEFQLVTQLIPSGIITMWSGSIASIPGGWYLCNGSNGTPDLRDRFVVGAGSTYAVNATGGSANATLVSHTHTVTTASLTGTLGTPTRLTGGSEGSVSGIVSTSGVGMKNATAVDSTTGNIVNIDASHTHTLSTEGSSATNANLPPYYALAYIMKA